MRLFVLILLIVPILAACTPPAADSTPDRAVLPFEKLGTLQNPKIDEASGLARSWRDPNILWVINDSGQAFLYAIDKTGAELGRTKIPAARNRDWEDLASFTLDGVAYLLIGDIGDNKGKKDLTTLYVVEEPEPGVDEVDIAWRIDVRYPDGPRDAEAIAVDGSSERIFILSKRDIPAVLYEVPLRPENDAVQIATRLGQVTGLPQPSRRDVDIAYLNDDWFWQPTGMDLSDDGLRLAVLTYGGIYVFSREHDEEWIRALSRMPAVVSTIRDPEAESIVFDHRGDAVLITREQKHAPLVRFELPMPAQSVPPITIMTFNVQNLFDNVDDAGKDDKAYLPIADKQAAEHIAECNEIPVESWRDECLYLDWSEEAIDRKLTVLAEAIQQVNDGRGADIIALQEIENIAILERLRNDYLAGSAYLPAILVEGTDLRGVDVAFLSRLPLAQPPELHYADFSDFPDRAADTRGVLEATFELPDGSLLTGFSVHFPAPFHPTEMRILAYEHLTELRNDLPDTHSVFAAGDFNTTSTEMREKSMLERFVKPYWTVTHEQCKGCPGTHYYASGDNWSFLDMILFSPSRSEKATWRIRADSFGIANRTSAQVTADGKPQRHNAEAQRGVSDHWPLIVSIESVQKQ